MTGSKFRAQFRGIVIWIEVDFCGRGPDRLQSTRRWPKGIFVGGQLDHSDAGFPLCLPRRFPWHISLQRADVRRDEIEDAFLHQTRSVTGLCITKGLDSPVKRSSKRGGISLKTLRSAPESRRSDLV